MLLEKDYKINSDAIDLYALIDNTLTFYENWMLIKNKYVFDRFCSCCGQYVR